MTSIETKKPNYRGMAFLLILMSELVILVTRNVEINATVVSAITTLLLVVILAFLFSGLLRSIKSMTLKNNYLISGVASIFLGILYFIWIRDHIESLLAWLQSNGLYILLGIILLSAAFLLLNKGERKSV